MKEQINNPPITSLSLLLSSIRSHRIDSTKAKPSLHLTSLIPPSSSSSCSQDKDAAGGNKENEKGSWLTKEQVAEFSKILFKCIKPIGEPEFRITDDIATHTITLKIDMTAIDLRHAEALCTGEQVRKYEGLGLRREEIAEVALKLNAIKHLGISLRIDDLFDEHGFMVVDGSEVQQEEREDAVYFVEDGRNSIKGKEKLLAEELARSELVDLTNEKERVIDRERNGRGEGRETDLLQSMTMKIRFMKSVVNEEVRSRLITDSEQVMFESCDQVQMKLTQLELNTVRLMCTTSSASSSSLASNLGMINKRKEVGPEDYMNADAHQPFMDLLLEQQQGKTLDSDKKEGEEEEEDRGRRGNERGREEGRRKGSGKDEMIIGQSILSVSMRNPNCHCFACIGAVAAQQADVSPSILAVIY